MCVCVFVFFFFKIYSHLYKKQDPGKVLDGHFESILNIANTTINGMALIIL